MATVAMAFVPTEPVAVNGVGVELRLLIVAVPALLLLVPLHPLVVVLVVEAAVVTASALMEPVAVNGVGVELRRRTALVLALLLPAPRLPLVAVDPRLTLPTITTTLVSL